MFSEIQRYHLLLRTLLHTVAASGSVLLKKIFLEIFQNSQENTCTRFSGTGVFL